VYCFAKFKNIFPKHNLDTLLGHKIAEIIPKMKEGDKNKFLFFVLILLCTYFFEILELPSTYGNMNWILCIL